MHAGSAVAAVSAGVMRFLRTRAGGRRTWSLGWTRGSDMDLCPGPWKIRQSAGQIHESS